MEELKTRIEAILFASSKTLTLEEIAKLAKERDLELVKNTLLNIKKDLEEKKSSTMLIDEENKWRLVIREKYIPFVRKIVTQTEITKSILETLAVVAYKAPVLQSKVIKIRTNKAYKHLDELEAKGYITREKHGRTKMIKLSQRFYDYFELPKEKIQEKFGNVQEIENAIEEKEKELGVKVEEDEETVVALQHGKHADNLKSFDTIVPVENIEKEKEPKVEIVKETIGELEVYEKPKSKRGRKPKTEVCEEVKTEAAEKLVVDEEKKTEENEKQDGVDELKKEGEKELKKTEENEQKPKEKKKKIEEELGIKIEKTEEKKDALEEQIKREKPKESEYKSKGLFPKGVPPELEEKVEEKVKEIMEGKEEEKEESDDKNKE